MSRPLVLVTRALPDDWLAPLRGPCELVIGDAEPAGWQPQIRARLPEAVGLFTLLTERVDADVLAAAPRLRVISNMAVGVDNIDVAACTARRIPVGHTPGVLTEATADLTMALVLAWCRRLLPAAGDARAGRWSTWSPTGWLGRDLAGARLGLLGFGQIARAVARRARAFGMDVVFTTRSPAAATADARAVTLDELLATADIVSVHVPATAATHHLVDGRALARMKPDALLVNTARGSIVDTDALLDALRRGGIAGAALDVTDPEPLPPAHPFYAMANVLVVPHIGSATAQTRRRMAHLAAENLLAGLAGAPLPHCVNPDFAGATAL